MVHRPYRQLGMLTGFVVIVAGCGGAATTTQPSAAASSSITETAGPTAIASDIVGYWHRAQACEEMLSAFEAAGLADSQRGWLQGNFYGGAEGPATGDPCAGAEGPLEHSHWFTAAGEFGSHDQAGQQVDNGDYTLLDADTLAFPSHAGEGGYTSDVLVDFRIENEIATF